MCAKQSAKEIMEVSGVKAPSVDAILVSCPACGAWPMAANVKQS